MHHAQDESHHPNTTLAQSAVEAVSICPCGEITVSLQYMSLRFEPGAFRDLQALLTRAQRLLDADRSVAAPASAPATELPSMH